MKIVIDARIIETSTGVYMQRLVHYLHQLNTEYEIHVLVPGPVIDKWSQKYPQFAWHAANQKPYTFGEQLSLTMLLYKLNADLVHFTMPQQPLLYFGRTVTTVHDTTLIRFENIDMNKYVYKIRKFIFLILMKIVLRRSEKVLTPTDFVREDLINFSKTKHPEKFITTLEAGDPDDSPVETIEELENKRYFAFVGNAFPFKNVGRVIDAFEVAKKSNPDLHLALAGKKEFFYEQLESDAKRRGIKDIYFLGFISAGQKRWLYQHADAMVTASLSEGFCIPLLEAMYEDCPVLSSNVSCLPEVAGDAALYFDPTSTNDLAEKMQTILSSPDLRSSLIERGRIRVKQFSWERMAEQSLSVYNQTLESR